MTLKQIIPATSLIALLSACGGGSTGGGLDSNGISSAPVNGAELEMVLNNVASASGAGTLDALTTLEGDVFDTDLAARNLTAPGSASYEGVVVLADFDISPAFDFDSEEEVDISVSDVEEDLPSFAMLGRSVINVTFGAEPEVSGGANGFVGVNVETVASAAESIDLGEDPDISAIIDALPTVNVNGSLTYSGGEIIDFDPTIDDENDLGLGFDVTGNLALTNALTGNGNRDVTIDGQGLAAFTEEFGIGAMDLNSDGQTLGGIMIGVDPQ